MPIVAQVPRLRELYSTSRDDVVRIRVQHGGLQAWVRWGGSESD